MGQQSFQGGESDYIDHPRIHDKALESRTYQEVISAQAADANTMVVLPTGLGKTTIAILLAAHRMEQEVDGKVLMLAPTRPLVEQHRDEFERCLDTDTGIFEVLTGDTRPEKRADHWKETACFFATPQVVENDIINDRLDLSEFSLIIFDESHRATGDYPYNFVADRYVAERENERILALTASPGSDREKIEQVAESLHIDNFEVRTDDDPDVKPYIQDTTVNWQKVELDNHFKQVKKHLEAAQRTRLKKLKKLDLLDSISNVKKTDLLKLRSELGRRMNREDNPDLYKGMSLVAACMKIQHALELLETQGIRPLYQFFEKMKKDQSTKAAQRLMSDEDFQEAITVTEWMYTNGKEHPKMAKLQDILDEEIEDEKNAIVFTQFRNTVDLLHDKLDNISHLEPVKFKGQKDDFTQKKQLDILDRFRDGEHNILVSTSVGEEGLDIPSVDYVVFYEPVASEVRSIQRKGRTGRQEEGEIYVLMAKNTRDEGYYWSAKNKEKQMKQVMNDLKSNGGSKNSGTTTIAEAVERAKQDKDDGSDESSTERDTDSDGGAQTADEGIIDDDAGDVAKDVAADTTESGDTDADDEDLSEGQHTLNGFSAEDGGIVIYADDRENRIMKELTKKEATVRSHRLEIGDFLVSDRVVVERKRADDFVGSIIDNRLFSQLKTMREEYQYPVLIIEGESLYTHRNIHPNAIRGALSSIAIDYEVPILWADDVDETVDMLIALAKREQEDNDRSITIRGESSPKTENELQKYIVSGLPNISETLAERLLEHFDSVYGVFTASETALKNVEGIGEEKAARIKDIIEREYTEG